MTSNFVVPEMPTNLRALNGGGFVLPWVEFRPPTYKEQNAKYPEDKWGPYFAEYPLTLLKTLAHPSVDEHFTQFGICCTIVSAQASIAELNIADNKAQKNFGDWVVMCIASKLPASSLRVLVDERCGKQPTKVIHELRVKWFEHFKRAAHNAIGV